MTSAQEQSDVGQRCFALAYLSENCHIITSVFLQAQERTGEAYDFIYPLIKKMLLIISRPSRLLECLVSLLLYQWGQPVEEIRCVFDDI